MRNVRVLFVLLLVVAPALTRGAVVIDDFEVAFSGGTLISSTTPETLFDTSTGIASSILGTEREATLVHTAGLVMTATSDDATAPGELGYGEVLGEEGSLTLLYDGVGSAGLGSFDLSEGGDNTRILVSISAIDTTGTITVTVTDGDSSDSVVASVSSTGAIFFEFADYTGIDFTDIEAIEVEIDGDGTLDIAVDVISAIPEPGTSKLALLLLVAFVGASRRVREHPAGEKTPQRLK